MCKLKKNLKKIMGLMLAIAMVFTLNVTSLAVDAEEVEKPTTSTMITTPSSVSAVKVKSGTSTKTAKFYTDDYGDETYIRPTSLWSSTSNESVLKSVTVDITMASDATDTVTLVSAEPATGSAAAQLTYDEDSKTYSLACDLLNHVAKIKIGTEEYVIASGIASGSKTPTEAGFVASATLGDSDNNSATVTRTIVANACPGNIYYMENKDEEDWIDWTSITYYINASDVVSSNKAETTLNYTLVDGTGDSIDVDLSTGTATVTINGHEYRVSATFAETSSNFVASSSNFRIDFQELENYVESLDDPSVYAAEMEMAEEIETGVAAYYASSATQKTFPEGTTNMQVLQTILQWCADNDYIDGSATTLGSNVTYVSEINGLGEFSVGYMSGWMYTDNPASNVEPENWYTPSVGGASYELSPDSNIAWFYTVDYTTHPW